MEYARTSTEGDYLGFIEPVLTRADAACDILLLRSRVPGTDNLFLQSIFLGAFFCGLAEMDQVKIMRAGEIFKVARAVRGRRGPVGFGIVLTEWLQGRTIALNHIYQYERSLARLCSIAMENWDRLLHLNAYWSPRASRGAGRHSDEHDVLVLQCHGRKNWRIWTRGGCQNIELCAGDVLFVKAGVEHDPCTGESGSFHVTLGFSRMQSGFNRKAVVKKFNGTRHHVSSSIADPVSHFDACDALCSFRRTDRNWCWREGVAIAASGQGISFCSSWGERSELPRQVLLDTFEQPPAAGQRLLFRSNVPISLRKVWMRLLVSNGLARLAPFRNGS